MIDMLGERKFAQQRQADLAEALHAEETSALVTGRAFVFEDRVWHILKEKHAGIAILDMRSYCAGFVTDCFGNEISCNMIENPELTLKGREVYVVAATFQAPSDNPDIYFSAEGGEWIYVSFHNFTVESGRAWVSTQPGEGKSKWFPLDCIDSLSV